MISALKLSNFFFVLNLLTKAFYHLRFFGIVSIIIFGISLAKKTVGYNKSNDNGSISGINRSDAAGYYVFLPSFFIYHFKSENFPNNIEDNCAHGFSLKNGKVYSKYPLGIAIAYCPFFLVAHALAENKNGFSAPYYLGIHLAAVFYCTLGLIFSFLFFSRYVRASIAFICLIPLFYGTNLMFYTLKAPGYSHVVSFCLISIFLYCLSVYKNNQNHWCKWILPLLVGFIISVRMMNGIVIFLILLWDRNNIKYISSYFAGWVSHLRYAAVYILFIFLFLLPQYFYNREFGGHGFAPIYPEEHFTNFRSPKLSIVLFGAPSGLYLYTPLFLILTLFTFFSLQENLKNSRLIIIYFIIITLIYSSWYAPSLGCSFSHRGYLDYLTLFSFPFVWSMDYLVSNKKWIILIATSIGAYFFCLLTLRLYNVWWYCFYGKHDFDYSWVIDYYFNKYP
jgi:hypothetical protein